MTLVENILVGIFSIVAGSIGTALSLGRVVSLPRLSLSLLALMSASVLIVHGALVLASETTWTQSSSSAYYALTCMATVTSLVLHSRSLNPTRGPFLLGVLGAHALFAMYVAVFEMSSLLGLLSPPLAVIVTLLGMPHKSRHHHTLMDIALMLVTSLFVGSGYLFLLAGARHDWLWPPATLLFAFTLWRRAPDL